MLRRILGQLERGAFRPDTLPADVVAALALTPPVLAGLLLFHLVAAEILALAVGIGAVAHLAARFSGRRVAVSPVLPAVVAVALAGPAAPQPWILVLAILAAALELARARVLPGARLQTGLLAYSVLFLASGGIFARYLNPGSLKALPEPIAYWSTFQVGTGWAFDPVRLYVGTVPGPVLATSLLAVAVAAAWLWYARRLSLAVLTGFLAGAAVAALNFHWNVGYQLDSGPMWFAAALLLADRRFLAAFVPLRPVLGVVAGAAAVAARSAGYGVEATFLAVAAAQLGAALLEGATWVAVNRRQAWESSRRAWRNARGIEVRRKAA